MKTKRVFILVATVMFSVCSYGQDMLLKGADSMVENVANGLPGRPDKGKAVENGLFFIKLFYEETDSKGVPQLESAKKIDDIPYSRKFLKLI